MGECVRKADDEASSSSVWPSNSRYVARPSLDSHLVDEASLKAAAVHAATSSAAPALWRTPGVGSISGLFYHPSVRALYKHLLSTTPDRLFNALFAGTLRRLARHLQAPLRQAARALPLLFFNLSGPAIACGTLSVSITNRGGRRSWLAPCRPGGAAFAAAFVADRSPPFRAPYISLEVRHWRPILFDRLSPHATTGWQAPVSLPPACLGDNNNRTRI